MSATAAEAPVANFFPAKPLVFTATLAPFSPTMMTYSSKLSRSASSGSSAMRSNGSGSTPD